MAKAREAIVVERHRYDALVIYEVSSDELIQLERETLSISEDFSFAAISLTAAISFIIAIFTTDIKENRTFDVFVIVTVLGFLAAAYFGIRWWRGRRSFQGVVTRIKERVGPLGEEGDELEPSELADLPKEQNPSDGHQ
jgi:hypothetical protein